MHSPSLTGTSDPVAGLVSVVLVNRNYAHLINLVFPCLAAQTYAPIEIVVVDNGSDDDSASRIREAVPHVRIIEMGENTGFSRALNAGIRESRGEFVLSLNFDLILEPTFVAHLIDAMGSDLTIGWAAGNMRRLTADGPIEEIDCNGHYLLSSRYCYGHDPDHPDPAYYDRTRDVFGASGCAALYRRRMLESLACDGEIFDEHLFAYFEDIDLDWRAHWQGYRCVFVPAARGAHMRQGMGPDQRSDVTALLLANRFLVILKNDTLRDFLHDVSPIVKRILVDIRVQWRRGQLEAVAAALARFFRFAPHAWRKRRASIRSRRPGPSPVQRFRLPTRFLG